MPIVAEDNSSIGIDISIREVKKAFFLEMTTTIALVTRGCLVV